MRRHKGSKYTNAAKSARHDRASAHVMTYNHCANRNQAGNPDTCPPPTRRRPDAYQNRLPRHSINTACPYKSTVFEVRAATGGVAEVVCYGKEASSLLARAKAARIVVRLREVT